MATKEQCAQCNLFNSDVCEQNSSAPVYDQTSCPHYEKRTANQGGAGETEGVYPPRWARKVKNKLKHHVLLNHRGCFRTRFLSKGG